MQLTDKNKREILDHFAVEYPNECCGLIVDGEYVPCDNLARGEHEFKIHPREIVRHRKGLQAIVHSHPHTTAALSPFDKQQLQAFNIPWVITDGKDFRIHDPAAAPVPLIGRSFIPGVQDCLTLVQDYYERELGIIIEDVPRCPSRYKDPTKPNMIDLHFERLGFEKRQLKGGLQPHDVVVTETDTPGHGDHFMIFLGGYQIQSEDTVPLSGTDLVLQQLRDQISGRTSFTHRWQTKTQFVLRYKGLK